MRRAINLTFVLAAIRAMELRDADADVCFLTMRKIVYAYLAERLESRERIRGDKDVVKNMTGRIYFNQLCLLRAVFRSAATPGFLFICQYHLLRIHHPSFSFLSRGRK